MQRGKSGLIHRHPIGACGGRFGDCTRLRPGGRIIGNSRESHRHRQIHSRLVKSLERSTNDCESVVDPKVNSKPVIYVPAEMAIPEMLEGMKSRCGVELQHLPKLIHQLGDLRPDASMRPGLLYLPNPYVVPGGHFNEMYGWDGSSNIALSAGYKTNVIGFGWTNGVYAMLAKSVLEARASDSQPENDTLRKQPRDSSEGKERLQFALILSRHGIRPPLEQPSEYSAQPWPTWEVPLGHLTPHGGEALRRMGAYMRLKYARAGLIAGNTCPGPADVYLYSDTDERNVSSMDQGTAV
jgi:Trehalase